MGQRSGGDGQRTPTVRCTVPSDVPNGCPAPTDGEPLIAKARAVLATIPEGGEEEASAVGSAEEANTTEHMMTHLPKNPHCEVCATATIQSKRKRSEFVVLEEEDARAKKLPGK